jgi:signal transduction histidine kinase/DNA-binding NarL/FixJ family response regulator
LHGLIGSAEQLAAGRLTELTPGMLLAPEEEIQKLAETARLLCENADQAFEGNDPPRQQTIPCAKLLHSVRSLVLAMGRVRSQEMSVTFNGIPVAQGALANAPMIILRDTNMAVLLQMIGNLVSNAAKFTPPNGQVSVDISAGAEFVCTVDDSGDGVSPQFREIVFSRFERGPDAHGTDGIGLGLSIVRTFADRAGGHAYCTDRPGAAGARFVIRLPYELSPDSIPPSPKFPHNVAPRDLGDILLVDDNALNLKIIAQILRRLGATSIFSFTSSESALEHVEVVGPHFSLAFVDFVLPGADGVSLTRDLRRLHGDKLVVVGASASASPSVYRRWTAAGAARFMPKPFRTTQVRAILDWFDSSGQLRSLPPPVRSKKTSDMVVMSDMMGGLGFVVLVTAVLPLFVGAWILSAILVVGGLSCLLFDPTHKVTGRVLLGHVFLGYSIGFVFVASVLMGCDSRGGHAIAAFLALTTHHGQLWVLLCSLAVVAVGVLSTADMNQTGICRPWIGSELSEIVMIDALHMMLVWTGAFIYVSFLAASIKKQEWWTHTLSHDLRAPLHGILALSKEIDVHTAEKRDSVEVLGAMSTVLSATVDTVLMLTEKLVSGAVRLKHRNIPVEDLANFIASELSLNVTETVDTSGLFETESGLVVGLSVSPVYFAIARFVALVPLHARGVKELAAHLTADLTAGRLTLVLSGRQELGNDHSSSFPTIHGTSLLLQATLDTLLPGSSIDLPNENGPTWSMRMCFSADGFTIPTEYSDRDLVGIDEVIVVDDNILHRRIASRMLDQLAISSVRSFGSFGEFSEYDSTQRRDATRVGRTILLADLHLPDLTGPAAWNERWDGLSRCVVIACSGDDSARSAADAAGFHGFLSKPFSLPDLREVLATSVACADVC